MKRKRKSKKMLLLQKNRIKRNPKLKR